MCGEGGRMKNTLSLAGSSFLFLAGVAAGVYAGIHGSLPLVTAESPVDKLHPLLLLPDIYYPAAVAAMVGFAALLRSAARRVV